MTALLIAATAAPAVAAGKAAEAAVGKPVISAADAPEATMAEPTRRTNAPRSTSSCTRTGASARTTAQLSAPMTVMAKNSTSPPPSAHTTTASTRRTPESRATSAA